MNSLTKNLTAAGLNPIIIDENTDMSTLPSLNGMPPETPPSAPTDDLIVVARLVARTVAKVTTADTQIAAQRELAAAARKTVSAALDNGGKGFDDASRAFKAASNRLDRLLEGREALVKNTRADLDLVRDAVDKVQGLLRTLED